MSLKHLTCPSKTLAASINSSATSFRLNNIKGWDDVDLTSADFGSQAFAVIRNANNTLLELIEFDPTTIANSSITIVRRGLKFTGDLTTEVAANKRAWTKGDTFVDIGVDTPQMYQWLQEYVDSAIVAGGVPATNSTAGLVKTANPTQVDAGTGDDGTYKYVVTADFLKSRTYLVDSGSANTYVITPSPAISAYVAGQTFTFKATNANTGTSTLNVSGLGTKTIKKINGDPLLSGNIVANQIVTVVYDGTDFIATSQLSTIPPVINIFSTASTVIGDSTTQFDVTNPSGTTFRYTWDSTGTNPNITSSNPNVGDAVSIIGTNLAAGNQGVFIVTGSGTNYFEVTNASGVVESNKTISTGEIAFTLAANLWTKDAGLKYITIEGVGGGGGHDSDDEGAGRSGGYFKKTIAASSLSSTEIVTIGKAGTNFSSGGTTANEGGATRFGLHAYARGGGLSAGGVATGGDINIDGQNGENGSTGTGGNYPVGGSTPLGLGGKGNNDPATGYGSGGTDGQANRPGILIVTEYYE